MTATVPVKPGSDLRDDFRRAYENRYTWEPGFSGYRGRCIWQQGDQRVEGTFEIGADLKAKVEGIENEEILKGVNSQLWEVAIHRVRRSFEQTHGENTFTAGDTNEVGTEVLVGGKGAGDKYRIKDDVVTMVHRHIHGTVVTIYTTDVTDTVQATSVTPTPVSIPTRQREKPGAAAAASKTASLPCLGMAPGCWPSGS